ncbi:MAG: acyl-CoA desaturase [Phycisphaerales bacterium]
MACAEDERAPLRLRLINLAAVLLPLAGLVMAIVLLWGVAFNWVYLGLLVGMYLLTALGVTVGYHRYFTHRSFNTPRPVGVALAILGSMAVEGPVLRWVATHRRHHQHSDQEGDPHSPHTHGDGVWGTLRGIWHAHMGWLFGSSAFIALRSRNGEGNSSARYVKDLESDGWWRWMSHLFPVWVLLGLLLPAAIGGLATMSWMGVLLGFIWGGLVRVLVLHHVTWSINSVCHLWGTRPFRSHDHSRNNAIFGVLALGEGWHNNHHAFPTSARHGLRWWELDVSWMLIWAMSKIGLASDLRVPAPERVASKRAR